MRSFILTFLACISICINAQEQYGIAINDSDKMVMTPCTIVGTASVMTKVNNYIIKFKKSHNLFLSPSWILFSQKIFKFVSEKNLCKPFKAP